MSREIEKIRQVPGPIVGVPRIRQFGLRIPKLIEERMAHGLDRGQALGWSVFQQSRDQINGLVGGLLENLKSNLCQYEPQMTYWDDKEFSPC